MLLAVNGSLLLTLKILLVGRPLVGRWWLSRKKIVVCAASSAAAAKVFFAFLPRSAEAAATGFGLELSTASSSSPLLIAVLDGRGGVFSRLQKSNLLGRVN